MQTPHADAPLILTATLAAVDFAYLDGLRRRYFPAALNRVPAHISLFHHLPGEALDEVRAAVKAACARVAGPFTLASRGPRSLGRGVALRYEGGRLAAIRSELTRRFDPWLTAQDRQPFDPHVTIQNKVTAPEARALLARLETEPFPACEIEGLTLWFYRDGPWDFVETCHFGPAGADPSAREPTGAEQ